MLTIFISVVVMYLLLLIYPPVHIITDPQEISQNISTNETLVKIIIIRDRGEDLKNLIITKYNTTYNENYWLNLSSNNTYNMSENEIISFQVTLDATNLTQGEYRGYIEINANKSMKFMGESKPKLVGQIPVVLNVAEAKGSPTEGATQKESIINVKGNITINEL
ncbi:hypothetical protein [Methanocrinis sp.]|uniref:hypothetical protein n=1 Tax=Methanocrinis sp. TaxID=3101522 RepID=UPI003D0F6EDD